MEKQRKRRKRAEDGHLDFGAPETRFGEHPTDNRVVENGENKMLELDLNAGHGRLVLLELMVQVIILRLPSLVGLRALDGGHEGVRNGRVVVAELPGRRRDPVQGYAEAELQRLELEPRRVGRVASTRAGLA